MLLNRNRAEARMDRDGAAATVLPRIGPDRPELLNETNPRLISCIDGHTLRVG